MAGTTVTLQAVSAVVEKGLQLKELDIWGSELMGTDEDVTRFAAALTESQLRALYLKRVAFSEVSSLDALVAACQSSLDILMLEELDWKGVISDNVFRLLKSSRLAQLGMSKLQLKESHFTGIAEGLKSSSLRYLTLVDTVISDKAAAALAEALTVNENLKRLCLIRCSLSDNAAAALARMLRVNTTLNVLELSDNGIGDTGAIEISNALLDPSSPVKSFELLGNKNIGEAGIQAILQLAEQSHGLESLKLFGFSRKSSSKEQMEIQKKINSYMKFNARIGATSQNPGKRPKVWYE